MVLVDSSSWIHYLRHGGDRAARERVVHLLQQGEAAWCPLIRLELWNGVGSDGDRAVLREHERGVRDLPISDAVWHDAFGLASRCRRRGKTAPANDVLIAACARHHGVKLETTDLHFDFLMRI